jgi:DHA1 family tetracycline resistance protein-like MFS transporter
MRCMIYFRGGLVMQKSRLTTIFLVVLVDMLGFSLILPLLPYYAETFGATPTIVGLLVASYAAAQMIGAPLLGRFSDRFGRRPILLISIFGTFVGFVLLGVGGSLLILFISHMLDGLTGGNITVAQAYITDVTDEKNRAKGLGMIGAAFGLGFILGPAAGGLLSTYGYAVPSFVAAGLALINLAAVFFFLPESLTAEKRAALTARPRPAFSLGSLMSAMRRPRVGPLLHVRFFFGLAFAIFQSVFALYAQYRLNLDVRSTSFILTYVGVLSVIVQGFGVGRLTGRFSDRQLIMGSVSIMAVSLLAWALTPNVPVLLLVLIPTAVSGGILNTVLSSALTKAVYPEEIGGTLGLAASVESVTRVLAPTIGGVLLQQAGTWAPGAFGALIMVWVVSFTWRRFVVNPDPPLPSRAIPVAMPVTSH